MSDMKRTSGWDPNDTEGLFYDQARHLVNKGAIVCLDEFHNIDLEDGQLVYYIKRIVDVTRSPTLTTNSSGGGIFAAGLHQQNMLRLLGDPREPLYDRFFQESGYSSCGRYHCSRCLPTMAGCEILGNS